MLNVMLRRILVPNLYQVVAWLLHHKSFYKECFKVFPIMLALRSWSVLSETYYAQNYAGIIGLGIAIWNFYQLIMLFMFPVLCYNIWTRLFYNFYCMYMNVLLEYLMHWLKYHNRAFLIKYLNILNVLLEYIVWMYYSAQSCSIS